MKENEGVFEETGEELLNKTDKLCEKEGREGWKLAQETMLKEKTSSSELEEAIKYVMLDYKPDYFRPALLSLCSKAVGGTSEVTISTAASLVLFGRAIGIHDDIIDKSRTKNRRPTVLGKFGKELALVLSDVLFFKGFTLLRKTIRSGIPPEKIIAILSTIERIWFEQSESEVLELRSRRQIDITPEECLAKIRMRASELEAVTRIGGILGCGSQGEVNILGMFGRLFGIMSMLRDEIIDVLELDVLRHRIRQESLPLPLVYTLQDPKARPEIISIISKKRLTAMDLQRISKASDDRRGLNYVAELITKMAEEACSYVELLQNKNKKLKLLITSTTINPRDWKPVFQAT
ncbi:MAG: polyprenyl synthetase family protein [Candidatus Bathyarchaeota archaeon]|nr:polyprenyl synthetase family protein [Candidatus Bathyarchaeota archaeon]MDH5495161.1 polyprenyl synthetase family protein [Candidatus Bathyarchaeota archaeon]